MCKCCRKRSSRVPQILTRRSQSALGLGTASWAAQNGHLHILEYLVERKFDKYTNLRASVQPRRPLRLFEVLARNRQSAVGLLGGTKSAREQPPRVSTIPPRQQLSITIWLAIRKRRVTRRDRIRIRIKLNVITERERGREREKEKEIQNERFGESTLPGLRKRNLRRNENETSNRGRDLHATS